MAEDLDTRAPHDMACWVLVAFGVDEVAVAKAEHGAVGKQLVQIGIRVAGWLLGLVLGVDDGDRSPRIFQTMSGRGSPARLVEVVPVLTVHPAAVSRHERLAQRHGDEVLEQPGACRTGSR